MLSVQDTMEEEEEVVAGPVVFNSPPASPIPGKFIPFILTEYVTLLYKINPLACLII